MQTSPATRECGGCMYLAVLPDMFFTFTLNEMLLETIAVSATTPKLKENHDNNL